MVELESYFEYGSPENGAFKKRAHLSAGFVIFTESGSQVVYLRPLDPETGTCGRLVSWQFSNIDRGPP